MASFLGNPLSRRAFLSISAMAAASAALDWPRLEALAQAAGPKAQTPVVVIGAGLGALTAGAFLARNGYPVTLLERHQVPGGYATSFDRAGGRFTFEVSLHATSAGGGGTRQALEACGVADKVPAVRLPDMGRLRLPGLELEWPQGDAPALVRLLSAQFPQEAQGIEALVRVMVQVCEESESLPPKLGLWDKVRFPSRCPNMWAIRDLTLAQLLDKHLRDPLLKSVLGAFWGYHGLPPSRLSAFYYAVATGGYLRHGSFYYRPRSQALSDALAGVIEAQGGQVLLSNGATAIELKDGAVAGVRDQADRLHPARAVISGASGPETFGRLLPAGALPRDYQAQVAGYRASISSFVVWLGLNQELGGRVPGYEIFLHQGHDPEADYRACLACDPRQSSAVVTLYDNAFPGYSRPGTSTVTVMMLSGFEPWRPFLDDYLAGRKQAYQRQKEAVAQALIQRAAQVIPGLEAMLEVREAATPLTNLRYTGNPEGALYGYEQCLDNAFMNRISNRTPVKGLYLASAWGNPGGGYTGVQMAGMQAVRQMMEDLA